MTTVVLAVLAMLTLIHIGYHPLAIAFEWRARRPRPPAPTGPQVLVSVIVPAYNERVVIASCLDSILAGDYSRIQLIVVDDGSTDDTLDVLAPYSSHPLVTVISRHNGGKAAALNTGIAAATGEVMVFADADGIFGPDTVSRLLEGFDRPDVGAVCGNDAPVNLDRLLPRLLAVLTHVTSLVRRALSVINCLSIVSGNVGAFRSHVVREVGGFTEGMVGEDLEITWRVHRAGYRVTFQPRAMVHAEVPSTVPALWKQRVRWTRGLIATALLHRDMLCRPRYGLVSYYITVNLVTSLLLPPLQLAFVGWQLGSAASSLPLLAGVFVSLLGVIALIDIVAAIMLDRAWRDLKLLYVVPAMLLYSALLSLVVAWSIAQELRGSPAEWNKLTRTGVIGRKSVARAAARRAFVPIVAKFHPAMRAVLRLEGTMFVSVPGPDGTTTMRTLRRVDAGFVRVLNDRSMAWPQQAVDLALTRSLARGRTDSAILLYRVDRRSSTLRLFVSGPVRILDDATMCRLHPQLRTAGRGPRPAAWVWIGVRQAWLEPNDAAAPGASTVGEPGGPHAST